SGLTEHDQRGLPRVTNGRLDLGAYQVQPAEPQPPPGKVPTTITIQSIGSTLLLGPAFGQTTRHDSVTVRVLDANGKAVDEGTVTFTDGDKHKTVQVQNGLASASFDIDNLGFESIGQNTIHAQYTDPGGRFTDSATSGDAATSLTPAE